MQSTMNPVRSGCTWSAQRRIKYVADSSTKERRDEFLDAFWCDQGAEALEHCPVPAHEKFCEVPFDGFTAEPAPSGRLQVLEERVRVAAIHLNLGEQWKGHMVGK